MEILVIDDEKIIRESAVRMIENAGHEAEAAATPELAMEALASSTPDAVLLDLNLGAHNGLDLIAQIQKRHPNLPVILFTAAPTLGAAVEAMRRGAVDVLEKPFTRDQLGMVLTRVQNHRKLAARVVELEKEVSTRSPEPIFESSAPAMRDSLDVLFRAAASPASVLILGESGTGKSVIARAVHDRSERAGKPFVMVSCPSLSKELLESELFGHVRGSFTGAMRDHWGKVKGADGGTLFLDEIGEVPLEIQPKLLRLLQDREYERLGENTVRSADVRVIAATNRDLAAEVAAGRFREDLFYRLNVITVELPPLWKRGEDLVGFAEDYLKFFAKQCRPAVKKFSADALRLMRGYRWPGNLRELRNAVERAVILASGPEVDVRDLPASLAGAPASGSAGPAPGDMVTLDALEAAHIKAILGRTNSLTDAAEVLGIDQATLYRKRKKLGLNQD